MVFHFSCSSFLLSLYGGRRAGVCMSVWKRREVWAAAAAFVLIYHAWMVYIAYVHFVSEVHGGHAVEVAAAARTLPAPALVESVHAAQLELELLRREQRHRLRGLLQGRQGQAADGDAAAGSGT